MFLGVLGSVSAHGKNKLPNAPPPAALHPAASTSPRGFAQSELMSGHLIDFFVPFLPLEYRHVKLCARDAYTARGLQTDEATLDEVAKAMLYVPKERSRSPLRAANCAMDHVLNIADSYIFTPYVYPASWSEEGALRQIVSLWLVTILGAVLLFLGCGALNFYYVFDHKLMMHPLFLKNQVKQEIELSIISIFWMSFPTVAIFFWEVQGNSRLFDNISESSLGWPGVFLSIAGFLFFTDMCIYWIHRFLHHKSTYKHLHKQHHIFKIPTPFASHAFHPLDGFLQSLPYHIYPFIFPLHKAVYLSLFVFVNIWTISIHDGDYRIPGP
ncbi:hypothetical protein F7725_022534 [Dissostichus mawsoni]|uniref:Fatty acid hydroxylase domain-containing protein n=1 Tax=Dissostichus mawsoni TaxID=36200 RepID=A0A7J5Z0A1_DISMA|nr:hypothetical protein F7725_022534 [Dissostichus mawsoni]